MYRIFVLCAAFTCIMCLMRDNYVYYDIMCIVMLAALPYMGLAWWVTISWRGPGGLTLALRGSRVQKDSYASGALTLHSLGGDGGNG